MAGYIEHALIKKGAIESRLYQEVLAARILDRGNSLVVAPTALGKTIIAVLLTAHLLKKNPDSKVLFLAPTKPLAVQHEKTFRKMTEIDEGKIALFTGTVSPAERKKLWKSASFISATPQTIENDLIQGRISMKDVGLCIFDEAHRAVQNYSYVFIANRYMKQRQNPLILALTASPGSESEKIQEVCKNLFVENIEIKTAEDIDVKPYTNEIEMDWIKVDLPPEFREIQKMLNDFMSEQVNFLKKIGLAKTANLRFYSKRRMLELQSSIRGMLATRGKTQPSLYTAISKVAALLKVSHAQTLLETQGIPALNDYFERMKEKSSRSGASKALKSVLAHEKIQRAVKITTDLHSKKVTHPKQKALEKLLQKQFIENPDSRVLVFNHYRDSIRNLVDCLENVPGVRAKRFIGQATKGNDKGMTQKEQIKVIKELEEGKYNTLIASSVAEEGLDIPAVDLVVFYEPVPSEIRTIQRRGRTGRLGKGRAVILMARNTRDEAYYWAANAKEKRMHSTLKFMRDDLDVEKGKQSKAGSKLDSQTTLMKFNKGMKDKILIYADHREQASQVTKLLQEKGAFVKVRQLEIGDYVISNDIIIERKTIDDFITSMLDGRLFNQLIKMNENYKMPLMLVEGSQKELFALRNVHRNAIIGCLTAIALNYRTPILFTENKEETAEYIYVTAKREQLGKDKDIKLRTGRKGLTVQEMQQFIVESLPLIGPSTAKNLLKHFGSVKAVFSAELRELQEAENIGKTKAKKIKKVIDSKYSGKK